MGPLLVRAMQTLCKENSRRTQQQYINSKQMTEEFRKSLLISAADCARATKFFCVSVFPGQKRVSSSLSPGQLKEADVYQGERESLSLA